MSPSIEDYKWNNENGNVILERSLLAPACQRTCSASRSVKESEESQQGWGDFPLHQILRRPD